MITTKFKVKKIETRNADGVMEKKFVPVRKTMIWGMGFWRECPDWEEVEKKMEGEKFLGLDSDSTLTHIRAFIDENDPAAPVNEYYNE
jgi:hypothetical protein